MKITAALANGAWLAASLPAWRRFRSALKNPEECQRKILRELLRENSASAFGRLHRFNEIRTYEEFCRRVPLMDASGLEPWVRRIMRGEQRILTCEPVTRLVPTSGSTGGRKLIPFTAGLQGQFNRAIAAWVVDLSLTHPTIPFGPAYWSISPALPALSDQGSAVPIGFDSDSAYLGGFLQGLVESTFAVPPELRWAKDVDSFRYLTLLCLLRQSDLRFVSVWHPSFLTLLLAVLPRWWDELLTDIEHGGCRRAATERPEIRRAIQAAPQRRRAHRLREIGAESPSMIWPRWRVVSCWSHGQAGLAAANLQAQYPHLSVQPKGLLATEAFVSVPFESRHPLAVTSHFYEFADESGAVHPAHALQFGRRYEVVVTTAGGLWRYRLGDLVEVEDYVAQTPSLRFVGRGGGVSDLCGEKLMESFVTEVLQWMCEEMKVQPSFVLLAPEIRADLPPRYTLFVEGEPPNELTTRLDLELRRNPHYAICRDLGQLDSPQCFRIARNAYETFCGVLASEGKRLGEIKPQTLSFRTDWRHHFVEGARG